MKGLPTPSGSILRAQSQRPNQKRKLFSSELIKGCDDPISPAPRMLTRSFAVG